MTVGRDADAVQRGANLCGILSHKRYARRCVRVERACMVVSCVSVCVLLPLRPAWYRLSKRMLWQLSPSCLSNPHLYEGLVAHAPSLQV